MVADPEGIPVFSSQGPRLYLLTAIIVLAVAGLLFLATRSSPSGTPPLENGQATQQPEDLYQSIQDLPKRESLTLLIPCLPSIGLCPNAVVCPASGVCCPKENPACSRFQPLPTPILCSTPGAPICGGGQACPPTLICLDVGPTAAPCVPGSKCADETTCPSSGLCPGLGRWCYPEEGRCPDGTLCPASGICDEAVTVPAPCAPGTLCPDGRVCPAAGSCLAPL